MELLEFKDRLAIRDHLEAKDLLGYKDTRVRRESREIR
jgi:hypothetical protein